MPTCTGPEHDPDHAATVALFPMRVFDRDYTIKRCGRCGMIFHSPVTIHERHEASYENYGEYGDREQWQRDLESRGAAYRRRLRRLQRFVRPPAKVLDVGCANGVQLKHLRAAGYDCYGVEVDPVSSALAREIVEPDRIFTGYLDKSPFLDASFDLVICSQTIEHVTEPHQLLEQIHACLKVGGYVQLDTPNFGGCSFRLLHERWKHVLPDVHVSMFTPASMRLYLEAAGFEVAYRRVYGCSYHHRREGVREFKVLQRQPGKTLIKLAGAVLTAVAAGDQLWYVAKKTASAGA